MVFLTKFKNTFFGVLKRPLNLESGEFRFHPGIDIESEILVKLLYLDTLALYVNLVYLMLTFL